MCSGPAQGAAATRRIRSAFQVLVEERDGIRPQLGRRRFAIARPVIGEKGVPGVFVDFDRDVLAGTLPPGAQFLGLRDRRVLVLFAEHGKQRAVKLPDQIEAPESPRKCAADASRSRTASASGLPNMTGMTVAMSFGSDGPPARA